MDTSYEYGFSDSTDSFEYDPTESTPIIDKLPIPLLDKIFGLLKVRDVAKFRHVSKVFKQYVENMDKEKIKHLIPKMKILNDQFEFKERYPDGFSWSNNYKIFGNSQLDWIRSHYIFYGDSTILETSVDLTSFLKEVRMFQLINLQSEEDERKREQNVNHFCTHLRSMVGLCEFVITYPDLNKRELEKIISNFGSQQNSSIILMNIKLPWYEPEIIDALLNLTTDTVKIRLGQPIDFAPKADLKEAWLAGIGRFVKNNDKPNSKQVMEIVEIDKSTGEKIIKYLQNNFAPCKVTNYYSRARIRINNRFICLSYSDFLNLSCRKYPLYRNGLFLC